MQEVLPGWTRLLCELCKTGISEHFFQFIQHSTGSQGLWPGVLQGGFFPSLTWVGLRCCMQAVLELPAPRVVFQSSRASEPGVHSCPSGSLTPVLPQNPWSVSGISQGAAPACWGLPAPRSYSRNSPTLPIASLKCQPWKVTYKGNLLGRIPSRSSSSITP